MAVGIDGCFNSGVGWAFFENDAGGLKKEVRKKKSEVRPKNYIFLSEVRFMTCSRT